jgi:hypothetical protein
MALGRGHGRDEPRSWSEEGRRGARRRRRRRRRSEEEEEEGHVR